MTENVRPLCLTSPLSYPHNGHGDVVQIVDTSGNIKNEYDYDVWGNFLKKEETIENHFTYFCQTYDETTGLYYLRARYYDPTTGRFTQQDPAEDGYNWYVYCVHNPIKYVDPTGYSWDDCVEGKMIFIDPGHGGEELGATKKYNGKIYYEKNLNLSLAFELKRKLEELGAIVHMSRTTDETVSLDDRYKMANEIGVDIFISVHHNSSRWPASYIKKGTTVIYPNNHDIKNSKMLADDINGGASEWGCFNYRNTYKDERGLAVLRGTNMPAVLTETGYMSNNKDMHYILNNQSNTAFGIANGVRIYFYKKE